MTENGIQTENALRFDKTGRQRTKTFSELIKKTGEKYIENTFMEIESSIPRVWLLNSLLVNKIPR